MKNNLTVFESEQFGKIRTVCIYGVPYFVGEDVAKILGYVNPQKALRNYINDEDKMTNELFNVNGTKGILINEIGLYSLVISSKSPIAKQFEKWIKNDVLPYIKEEEQTIIENNLMVFDNLEFGQLRMVYIDEKQYFIANDVAKALGYSEPKNAVARHCKGALKRTYLTNGGEQEVKVIPEGDVYRLIIRSKLPKAEEFEHWVFDEVLPSIRKHGIYATDNIIDNILANPDFGIQLLSQLKEERAEKEKLKSENLQQKQIIGELKPKADYTDMILQSKELVTITQIAKDYGMSGSKMNQLLHKLKVQYKQNGQWLLYSDYHAKGYTHSETIHFKHSNGRADTKMITKWTQKGRLFLYDLLKQSGVLPMIEQNIAA